MMFDVTALGELLIDFTPCGRSDAGMRLFEQNPGGAVANVLAACARFGLRTAFIGKVGEDMHGSFLRGVLDGAGINTASLLSTDEAPTTLAFVELDEDGERHFSFVRKPGADTLLRADELDDALLRGTRVFHCGSLSLTAEPSRTATLEAVRRAKSAGAIITYDPNYRAPLWPSEEAAAEQMRSLLPFADLVKLSASETLLVTGEEDTAAAIDALTQAGVRCTVITDGDGDVTVGMKGEVGSVASFRRQAVDTTGAGDAFWGGFISAMLISGKAFDSLRLEDMLGFARFGCATAACCVTRRGAIPAMPTLGEVKDILNS